MLDLGTNWTEGATVADIFEKTTIIHKIRYYGILCVAFSIDNASVKMGKINSMKSKVLVKNLDVYFVGCSYHMAHNVAHKGEDSFSGASRFYDEDLFVNLLLVWQKYRVQKRTKRVLRILWHSVFI